MGRKTQMNSLTTPELLEQVNPENKELLQEFLDYLRSTQRSEGTIRGYENDIQIAFVWNLQFNGNLPFVDWKKRQIVRYQNWLLNENKNSPARVKRLKASLSSFANFIENILDEDYPNFRNIIRKIEDPVNSPVREKTVLSAEELQELLDRLVEKKKYKQACFLALAMYSGRRKSELCRFRVSDFSPEHLVCDGALYKSSPIKTKGKGGGKMLECYTLAKKFQPYLDMWLEEMKKREIESEWLFPKAEDAKEHIEISTANSYSKTFSNILGKEVYLHSLRHYFVSELSRQGLPDSAIVILVGWSESSGGAMCSLYNDNPKDDQLEMWFSGGEIDTSKKKDFKDL